MLGIVDLICRLALVLLMVAFLNTYVGWSRETGQIIVWSFIGYWVLWGTILKFFDWLGSLRSKEEEAEKEEDDNQKHDWSELKEVAGLTFAIIIFSYILTETLGKGLDEILAAILLGGYAIKKIPSEIVETLSRDRGWYRRYKEGEALRRDLLVELREDTSDWNQIADVLNKKGFRDKWGEELTGDQVKDEHTQILLEKHR